jgi:predicted nucleic acid-binding protein
MSDEAVWYIDTSVLVTPFLKNRDGEVLSRCEAVLDQAARGERLLLTSWLTWDEATWAYGRAGGRFDRQRAAEFGEALLRVQFLRFVGVDRTSVDLANVLLARTGCRPRDCLHAAAALTFASGRMLSLDSDFRSVALEALGLSLDEP